MCKNVLSLAESITRGCKYNHKCPKCNEPMSQNRTAVKLSKFGMKEINKELKEKYTLYK
jgi:transcription initiation factor IIE alpha subunit